MDWKIISEMWKRGKYASSWNTAHSLSGKFFVTLCTGGSFPPGTQLQRRAWSGRKRSFLKIVNGARSLQFGHLLALFSTLSIVLLPFTVTTPHTFTAIVALTQQVLSVELSVLSFHPSMPLCGSSHPLL